MRSHEKPQSPHKLKVSLRRAPYERRRLSRRPGTPDANDAEEQASNALAGLVQEHRDLDGAITVLLEAGVCDPLLIVRMKKRKLQLKDEIARFHS
jgi:hypothetical protein